MSDLGKQVSADELMERMSALMRADREAVAQTREQAVSQIEEIARLRKGIQDFLDGNYGFDFKGSAHARCPHGCHRWETCEPCIEEHFQKVLGNGQSAREA